MPVLQSRGGQGDRYFLYETALKSSLSKHASSLSYAHTLSYHPQFYLYHPGETSGGMALHHTEDEENSGDAHDLLVLGPGDCGAVFHCHRELVLEGSALTLNCRIS